MPVPANCSAIGTGISPEGLDGCPFFMRDSALQKIADQDVLWKIENARVVSMVVNDPKTKIFEGLGRDGCLGACCYCGKPGVCYEEDGREIPLPLGSYFVVYCEPMSGGVLVCDWALRKEDSEFPGNPVGWKSFEKGQVWPKT